MKGIYVKIKYLKYFGFFARYAAAGPVRNVRNRI